MAKWQSHLDLRSLSQLDIGNARTLSRIDAKAGENMNQIDQTAVDKLRRELSNQWEVTKQYWYPLFNINRNDVIAFDKTYIDSEVKISQVIKLLKRHGVNQFYELWEDNRGFKKALVETENLWRSNEYLWYNEGYWFDDNYDWIIYSSHEQTVTIGGDWLIKELMESWIDWKSNINWDSKN